MAKKQWAIKRYDFLKGEKFNSWTVIKYDDIGAPDPRAGIFYICRCECGALKPLDIAKLLRGTTKSCMKCATTRRWKKIKATNPKQVHL